MEGDAPDHERYVDFETSPEAPTVYANILGVWFSPYEFALDWGLTEPVEPTGLVFDVLRMLNDAMTRYETIFGEIRRPEAR